MKKTTGKKIAAVILSAAMAVTMLAGCGKSVTSTSTSASTSASTSTATSTSVAEVVEVKGYSEAPMLAELVAAGKLAAVEDRIPDADNIFVDRTDVAGDALAIGNYGGEITFAVGESGAGSWGLSRPMLESIIHYNNDGSYYANVIKDWDVSTDYKTWTFYLREGMKWSDGDDFTADDITFWYYQCHLTNYDGKRSWTALKDGKDADGNDQFAVLTKVNDYEVTWTFQNPKYPGDFIENGDFKFCWAPSHYLSDLIPDSIYVENEYWPATGLSDEQVLANALAKTPAIDKSSIKDLGKHVVYNFWNASGVPTLNSFVLTTKEGNNTNKSELCILERNPYFWKVDAAGNQLPYVDALNFRIYSEADQSLLAFRSGEIDTLEVAMKDISSLLADLGGAAVLKQSSSSSWGSYQVTFNYTIKDENYNALFNNIKFREAMSVAVDRGEVSLLLSDGFLAGSQAGVPNADLLGYDADQLTKWTTYSVDNAKKLLEECGLVMGSDGFYNFADGTDLIVTFLSYTDSGAADAYPVLEQYWKAAGINCDNKDIEVGTFDETIDNNDYVAVLGPHTPVDGIGLKSRTAPFTPTAGAGGAEWYGDYGWYYETKGTENEKGTEPTGDMAKLVELYEQYKSAELTADREAVNKEVVKVLNDNMWTIAYLEATNNYTLVSSKLGNFPDNYVYDDLYQNANMVHYWTVFKTE